MKLVRYDAARRALAEARRVDEVKGIRDKAVAMQKYAEQAKDRQLIEHATDIRMRAERKAGELLRDMEKAKGARGSGSNQHQVRSHDETAPTLADLGVTKTQSSRWQKLAEMSDRDFEVQAEKAKRKAAAAVDAAARDALAEERRAENARLAGEAALVGRYETIVIDPPWDMAKIERDVRPNQVEFDYPTMGEDELAALPIGSIAADDCHLFCWTTQRFLPAALRLIEAWGFRYVLTMVWHKPGGFQPLGLPQYNCEFVVYARCGSPHFADTKAFNCCFEAPRREHSRKPDEFYDVIRRVTVGPRVDVFSREPRDGFAQHGNETGKFAQETA